MTEKKMVDVFSDVDRETAMTANPAGYAVAELGAEDERIVTMAADMSNTVADFIAKFPDRYIELGIAETNSVSVAAGLATAGLLPYIYSMSPFGMLKTAEQWRTDVDYNHLPVRLVGRLSGLAMGYFGTIHYAVEDIAIARTLNNTTVVSPGGPGLRHRPDARDRQPGRPGLHPDRRGRRARSTTRRPSTPAASGRGCAAAATSR